MDTKREGITIQLTESQVVQLDSLFRKVDEQIAKTPAKPGMIFGQVYRAVGGGFYGCFGFFEHKTAKVLEGIGQGRNDENTTNPIQR